MHRPNPRRIVPVFVLLLVLAGGYYLYSTGQLPAFTADAAANGVSGYIEGDEVRIAAEVGGRIELLSAKEGDPVTAGQELVRIDHTLLDAQLVQAQSAVEVARAQLAQIRAGARPEDVKQAETALAQAIAVREGARRAWENAQAVRDNPQELDVRIAAAQAQVESLKKQLEATARNVEVAQANAKAAAVRRDAFQGPAKTLPDARAATEQWAAAEAAAESARAGLLAAAATLDGAQKNADMLVAMRSQPLTANAQVDAAKAQFDAAAAAVDSAQARLESVKAGATKEQVAVAEAVVKQAESALGVLQAQMAKTTVKSPTTGMVTRRAAQTGEIAVPGGVLLTVASFNPVKLTIYVPETQIGAVKAGDAYDVYVDSFPKRAFAGRVTYVSPQAEFTPRNVQSKSERVNTVFAVRLEIPNAGGELKPGMPADAVHK
ncbi:MAG: efflux RND transporter periplasmic adaptor subunit [Chloroflexi bacterium]|nr:efflux RND transporter periplasmic adaptor subunit [Chloroflexota bacterium]